ncbi:hypothetical protein NIA69_16755 [Gemmiger formicilis]|nr:hypothetical protein [Gemmiger formicilis]
MAKLAIESTDALTSMRIAEAAGAAAAGPTARWKGYYMDLDWRGTEARPVQATAARRPPRWCATPSPRRAPQV